MDLSFIAEPELEFGTGDHIDIRFGIMNYGPFDHQLPGRPEKIKIAIVGTNESIDGARGWLTKCAHPIAAKETQKSNLFPMFPGVSSDSCFKTEILLDTSVDYLVLQREIEKLQELPGYESSIEAVVELFMIGIRRAGEKSVNVILCAMPRELLDLIFAKEAMHDARRLKVQFHDLLKARAMEVSAPLQLIRPHTYGGKDSSSSALKKVPGLQDEATRAWNFSTALYYKAGGFPWRTPRLEGDFATCFVGIAFFVTPDRERVNTSVAQVFNERGHGIAVRGSSAVVSSEDRQPHLTGSDSEDLIFRCLQAYRNEHRNWPARVVVHKTSNFTNEESKGCLAGAQKAGVDLIDLAALSESDVKLFRPGYYPPLRGTLFQADKRHHFLCTRGSVEFYEEYPGMYVPKLLEIKYEELSQSTNQLATEIMTLTKTNWNNVQIDSTQPITITAARRVGSILRWLQPGASHKQAYRFYM